MLVPKFYTLKIIVSEKKKTIRQDKSVEITYPGSKSVNLVEGKHSHILKCSFNDSL